MDKNTLHLFYFFLLFFTNNKLSQDVKIRIFISLSVFRPDLRLCQCLTPRTVRKEILGSMCGWCGTRGLDIKTGRIWKAALRILKTREMEWIQIVGVHIRREHLHHIRKRDANFWTNIGFMTSTRNIHTYNERLLSHPCRIITLSLWLSMLKSLDTLRFPCCTTAYKYGRSRL